MAVQAILVYDVSSRKSFEALDLWVKVRAVCVWWCGDGCGYPQEMNKFSGKKRVIVAVCANKVARSCSTVNHS